MAKQSRHTPRAMEVPASPIEDLGHPQKAREDWFYVQRPARSLDALEITIVGETETGNGQRSKAIRRASKASDRSTKN